MLSKTMEEALNEQLNAELASAYLYQAMAAYFEAHNLEGFAAWMDVQASEEQMHARKIYDYINARDGRVRLKAIAEPAFEWDNPLACFKAVLEHEQLVSKMIWDLLDKTRSENDHATEAMLHWFVNEQVEEEATADRIIQQLTLVKDAPSGIFMLDKSLGERGAQAAGTQ